MSLLRHLTKRLLFAVFVLYLVISLTFGVVALSPDPNIESIIYGVSQSQEYQDANASEREALIDEAVQSYEGPRNLDRPLHERYVGWLVDVSTFDWGFSHSQRQPVTTVLSQAIPTTLSYVLPAVLFSVVGGISLGVYAGFNPGSVIERLSTSGSYLAYGIPNFWLVLVVPILIVQYFEGLLDVIPAFRSVVLPGAVLGFSLLATQLRYTRAESREYVTREFITLIKAKGASGVLVARHVLRNAALPLLSLFFVDLLGVLVVNVFILEVVLGLQGIGVVGLEAIRDRDMPLVLGVTFVLAAVGVVGNLIQDIAYLFLDPRLEE